MTGLDFAERHKLHPDAPAGGRVYADTPPTVLAVPQRLLGTPDSMAAVAWEVSEALRRTPVWVLVPPSPALSCAPSRRTDVACHLANDPNWGTPPGDWTVALLRHHLQRIHVDLPIAGPDDTERTPRRSALVSVPGPLDDAAVATEARRIGSTTVRWLDVTAPAVL